SPERALGEGQERGIARLAPAELVGEAELPEASRVARVDTHRALEPPDGHGGPAQRERRVELEPRRGVRRRGLRAKLAEQAAEEAAGAEHGDGRCGHEESRRTAAAG